MIVTQKTKSTSIFTDEEASEILFKDLEDFTEEELMLFNMGLMEQGLVHDLASHEYDRECVGVRQWMEDEYYMGQIGKSIYKPWKEDLVQLFELNNYSTAIILGSIGSGKSTFSHLAVMRMLYEASCLKSPQEAYGLSSGSIIGFCNLAKSKETARRVVFEGIVSKLKESPYFQNDFAPIKDTTSEIIFPKGLAIVAGSSTDTSIIGMNIFGGVIDEGNFMRQGKVALADRQQFDRWGYHGKAGRLYDSVLRRMKSRYLKKGRLPGILLVVSSKSTNDSFTEQLIKNAKNENASTMFVRDRSIIDLKRDQFSSQTFKVVVGNENHQSYILQDESEIASLPPDTVILDIPEDLRPDFENNLEESMRDLAGVSTTAISSFISRVDMVDAMIEPGEHPFISPLCSDPTEWDSVSPYRFKWEKICRRSDNGEWLPIRNPGAKRFIHLDPASTGDAFGLCMAHVSEFLPVAGHTAMGDEIVEYQPHYVVDFILRIQGSRDEEVNFSKVRRLIYELTDHGYHIARITTDKYQSREMIQILTEKGYLAELLSVDESKDPYRMLRTAIYERRIRSYNYPMLFRELKKLEDMPDKVDHPNDIGKDLADALCGVCWSLFQSQHYFEALGPVKGDMRMGASYNDRLFELKDVGEAPEDIAARADEARLKPETVPMVDGAPKVYVKKGPQNLKPAYRKIGADGSTTDLRGLGAYEDFIVRG